MASVTFFLGFFLFAISGYWWLRMRWKSYQGDSHWVFFQLSFHDVSRYFSIFFVVVLFQFSIYRIFLVVYTDSVVFSLRDRSRCHDHENSLLVHFNQSFPGFQWWFRQPPFWSWTPMIPEIGRPEHWFFYATTLRMAHKLIMPQGRRLRQTSSLIARANKQLLVSPFKYVREGTWTLDFWLTVLFIVKNTAKIYICLNDCCTMVTE